MVRELVKQNASTAIAQNEYILKYDSLSQRYDSIINELNKLNAERTLREQKSKAMDLYIRTLRKSPQVLTEWNDTLWTVLVEKAIVHRDKSITFVFYNGNKVRV